MKRKFIALLVAIATVSFLPSGADACTGISLTAKDGSHIVARTIEWGGSFLNSQYVVVPRGYVQQSLIPGHKTGMTFTSRYGYVGFAVEQAEFVAEGLNEEGLAAGLFYFPGYGKYKEFDEAHPDRNIADLQVVPWILGSCKNVEEVKEAFRHVRVVSLVPEASTVHWRFTDATGHQIVLEIIDGKCVFYENPLGVLTNSPDFNWQLINLNNYVNLHPGNVAPQQLDSLTLRPFGAGSGLFGIPGDVTPPSRFVRAAFYQATAPQQATGLLSVLQSFQILNNFDIPIGIEFGADETPTDIPSATQWTASSDVTNRIIYFRTMYNSTIRSFDLKEIDFAKVKYQAKVLDEVRQQPVVPMRVA